MSLVAGFKQGRQAWAKAGFRLGAKGSTAWRWAGRGRKEKDLMVGQISFYVFCCCVVRMDGFVQNRINEFVQRQFGFFSRFYDLATPPSLHVSATCEEHVYHYGVGYGRDMSTGCVFQQVYRKFKTTSLVIGDISQHFVL